MLRLVAIPPVQLRYVTKEYIAFMSRIESKDARLLELEKSQSFFEIAVVYLL